MKEDRNSTSGDTELALDCPIAGEGPEIVCPRCGLNAPGVRCPRCDAVKVTACTGDCAACRASCGG